MIDPDDYAVSLASHLASLPSSLASDLPVSYEADHKERDAIMRQSFQQMDADAIQLERDHRGLKRA